MRHLAFVVLLSSVTVSVPLSARATDLPSRAVQATPIAMVPAFSWTGVYLGGELGWMGMDPDLTTASAVPLSSISNKNGLNYGALAGYNFQTGNLVLGVEGDFAGWTVGNIRYTSITGDFLTARSQWGGSIRGRVGYAADRVLYYVTGGAAFVSNKTSIPTTSIVIGDNGTRMGWTAGAGIDYAFTNNWFVGVEYRYTELDSKNFVYPLPIGGLTSVGFKQELSSNQVNARIGYKF